MISGNIVGAMSPHQRAQLDIFHSTGELPARITRAWLSKLSDPDLAKLERTMNQRRKNNKLSRTERRSATVTYGLVLKLRERLQ